MDQPNIFTEMFEKVEGSWQLIKRFDHVFQLSFHKYGAKHLEKGPWMMDSFLELDLIVWDFSFFPIKTS